MMIEHTQLNESPRDRLLRFAREEMIRFERREQQLRRADKIDQARKLGLPVEFGVEPELQH